MIFTNKFLKPFNKLLVIRSLSPWYRTLIASILMLLILKKTSRFMSCQSMQRRSKKSKSKRNNMKRTIISSWVRSKIWEYWERTQWYKKIQRIIIPVSIEWKIFKSWTIPISKDLKPCTYQLFHRAWENQPATFNRRTTFFRSNLKNRSNDGLLVLMDKPRKHKITSKYMSKKRVGILLMKSLLGGLRGRQRKKSTNSLLFSKTFKAWSYIMLL